MVTMNSPELFQALKETSSELKKVNDRINGLEEKLNLALLNNSQPSSLLTKREVARYLNCSERHVTYLLNEKKCLPFMKEGALVKIRYEHLQKYIDSLPPKNLSD